LPPLQKLIDVLDLRSDIGKCGYNISSLNLEAFYDELAFFGSNDAPQRFIQERL
jgi:hypothetical protein